MRCLITQLLLSSLALLGPAALAATTEYTVQIQNARGGRLLVEQDSQGRITTEFSYRNNGRGPDMREALQVNPQGEVMSYTVQGTSTFGAAIHAGLEVWYRNKHLIGVEFAHNDLISQCYSAIESTFAESPPSLFPDYRTSDYAIQSFHSYITHYQNENLTPFVHDGKPMVEFSFAYPLGKVELPISMFQQWGYGTLTNDAE